MQNHLAAAANQGAGNYWGVRHLKDKMFIQKVQPGLRTYIGTLRNRKVRSKICLWGICNCTWPVFNGCRAGPFIYSSSFYINLVLWISKRHFQNEWEVCEKKICFIYFIGCITQNFKSSSCHPTYFSRQPWIVWSLTCYDFYRQF